MNLSGNFTPKLPNVKDGGLLRRLINFSFDVQFGRDKPIDPHLKKKLLNTQNQSALLRLLVDEAVAWYRGDGLIISDLMKAATREHIAQNDFVAEFAAEFYVFGEKLIVKARDFIEHLRSEYPRECSRFSRAELIRLVEKTLGVEYTFDNHRSRIFKGLGRLADDNFCGEHFDNPTDVSTDVLAENPIKNSAKNSDLPFDPDDLPFD